MFEFVLYCGFYFDTHLSIMLVACDDYIDCITSESRTTIYYNARYDPKTILVNML